MKIGILHLSDLHIENDNHSNKVDLIARACEYDITQIKTLFIVITGDITKYGRKEEFDKAQIFLEELKERIKPKTFILTINIILVPGNHDCCFDNVKSTRKEIVKSCHVDIITENDYYSDATAVQNNYWDFYYEILKEIPSDKISFKKTYTPHIDCKITFHCYNSSWMSEKDEVYGGIVIPENKFLLNSNGDLVVSVFHHPLNWLSPNTKNNNKSRFEEHLINSSNIVLYGHEHDKGNSKNIYQKNNNVIFSEGKALQKDNEKDTGFCYIEIDLEKKDAHFKTYSWDSQQYLPISSENFELVQKTSRVFSLSNDFEKKLNTLNIPLKHSKKDNLILSDVFVYPDLEPITEKDTFQYPNAKEIEYSIKKETNLKALFEGEDQSGKTTLFFVFYKKLFEAGFLPVYIRGKFINNTNIKDIIKKAIKEQYGNSNIDLFLQQSKRVLLLDNLQKIPLNSKFRPNLLNNINSNFDFVLISSDSNLGSNLATDEVTILKDFDKYKILPLGYEKRSELIEQWFRIGENSMTIQEEHLLKLVQTRLDEINSLIGNRLMPSYPIFILTLLQGLDAQLFPHDYTQTTYGHCYHALITAGLVKSGLKNELSSYFNLLKELAFYLFDVIKTEIFTRKNYEDFYFKFKKDYFSNHSSEITLQNLLKANIIKLDDENFIFSYKYIFYYLVNP